MTSESWALLSRSPTLELPKKDDINSFVTSDVAAVTAGTLSPDIRLTAPPLFGNQDSIPGASVLRIGSYLLTKRLDDMSNGIAQYDAVHLDTSEKIVCRVCYKHFIFISGLLVMLVLDSIDLHKLRMQTITSAENDVIFASL